jgi:type VI secretion system secreted protein VgrG
MAHDPTTEPTFAHLESSDFPWEDLRIRKLAGTEAISRLFDFELDVVSLDSHGADASALAGASVAIVFERGGLELRRIHGMIAEVDDRLAAHAEARAYRLRIVPRAFRLSLVETQDIFMNAKVPDIIKQKLSLVDLGASDVDFRLVGTYAQREFVVQYKETDLAFVSRLAEHLGISFFFEHGSGHDTMVFTDHAAGFRPIEEAETVPFRSRGEERDVFDLEVRRRLIPTFYVVRDYNYRTPQLDLTSEQVVSEGYAGGVIEYGGHFKTPAEGKALAQVRAEERQSTQLVYAGRSDLCQLAAGGRVVLEGHPDLGPTEMLVVEVEHHATQVVGGPGTGSEQSYRNTFRATPAGQTYRPPRLTPRPRVSGLLTGVIDAGPTGTTTFAQIDDQGRYTVRFLFDTTAPGERPASRPVRMAQHHVGENYGSHFPLKPGVEVVLGFIDGDPDRPIIVGAVPNPLKPSPIDNRSPKVHRVRTGSGITVDMTDAP